MIKHSIDCYLADLRPVFDEIDKNALAVSRRVLDAFCANRVSARHFAPSNGYGYDDQGRDTLDQLLANILEAEDALVRPQIANGTHAIYLAVSALTGRGKKVLSVTDQPYDTLYQAMGSKWSLDRLDLHLQCVPFLENGCINREAVKRMLSDDEEIGLVYIQRSRGYAWRRALSVNEMAPIIADVKNIRPDIPVFVDNCYGECTELHEPCFFGADCVAGSLIKNLGGGLAPTGGYIAGTKACIRQIENALTVPGTGREVGSYAASYRPYYQGLFLAPHAVAQALKTAALLSAVLEDAGFEVLPTRKDHRADITQSIRFNNQEELTDFCRLIQQCSPVDSYVIPEPCAMPGYADPVIMAAGTFVQGATLELSADAPIREPYTVYLQGGLTLEHGVLAAERMLERFLH